MLNNNLISCLKCVLLISTATVAVAQQARPNYGTVIGIDLGTTYSWYFFVDINASANRRLYSFTSHIEIGFSDQILLVFLFD